MSKRCGFASVIGAPNAGKSTLVNQLVGSKVSIVSPKVQTTRSLVRGIAIYKESQIIFVDTPGIFKPKKRLERAMVKAAWDGIANTDILMLVVDASKNRDDQKTNELVRLLKHKTLPHKKMLILNKIDITPRDTLLGLSSRLNDQINFDATFMISASKADGTDDILNYLEKNVPEDNWHFPEDQISDMPARLLAAEITREKLFYKLHQELPYLLTVETESWENFQDGSVKISQLVVVSRENHKKIVLGKNGSLIKQVGQESRQELETLFGHKVHLKLLVSVKENWMDDPDRYRILGLDHLSG